MNILAIDTSTDLCSISLYLKKQLVETIEQKEVLSHSKVLAKNPKYDLAFYFQCNLNISSYRRWLELKKKVSLKEVKKSLKKRTQMDKKRKNSPLIKVKNAIVIRTDKLTKKQVLSKMSNHIDKIA